MQTKSTPVGIPSGTPVDPHLEWASELKEIDGLPTDTDAQMAVALARQVELWGLIARTPAETLAGVVVKLGLVPKAWDEGSTPHELELLAHRSGIEDLRRMDAGAIATFERLTSPPTAPSASSATVQEVLPEDEAAADEADPEIERLEELVAKGPLSQAEVAELAELIVDVVWWEPNELIDARAARCLAVECRRLYGGETPSA